MEEDVEKKYEKEFKLVIQCLRLQPGVPKYVVMGKTGVSSEIIDEFINARLIEVRGGGLKVARNVHHSESNNQSSDERRALIQGLQAAVNEDVARGRLNQNQNSNGSKLLSDLSARYNNSSRGSGWGR